MPANKFALIRYRIIDRCLRNPQHPYPSLEYLRQACENELHNSLGQSVSKSTIEKDLNAMRTDSALGFLAPIKYSRAHNGLYYSDPNYSIEAVPLNDEDIDAIKVAAITLAQYKNNKLFEQFGNLIGKIAERIQLAEHDITNTSKYIHFEPKNQVEGTDFIPLCLKAIELRRQLHFSYKKHDSTAAKHYTLSPYAIKEYRNLWYIIGLDLAANTIKTFAFDRIQTLEVSDEYAGKNTFDVNQYFNYTIGVTHPNDAKVEWIEAEISTKLYHILNTNPIHHSQQLKLNADTASLRLKLIINPELLSLLLSFGKALVIKKPSALAALLMESK